MSTVNHDGSVSEIDLIEGFGEATQRSRSALSDDVLLECLKRIATWHHMEFNTDAVLAGLPLQGGRLTPPLFLRAARRAGFRVRFCKRSLRKMPASILPAIAFLKGNRALVIEKAGSGENGTTAFVPDDNGSILSGEELRSLIKHEHSGYVALLHPAGDHPQEAGIHPEFATPASRRWWFWWTMWQFRHYYLRLLPASLLVNVFALVTPFFIMMVYDRVVPHHSHETLFVLAVGVLLVGLFDYIIRLVRGHVLESAGREMDMVLASTLYEQVLALEMRARPASPGVLAARTKAYEILREFFMSAAMLAMTDVPFALMMIGVTFFIGGSIGWILVVAAIASILVECIVQIPLRRAVIDSAESGMNRQAFISETINGMESVKAAHAEGALQHRLETMISESSEQDTRSHWYSLVGTSSTVALIQLTTVAIVVASVFLVQEGVMSQGGMIACVMLGARALNPLIMVAGLMTRLQQALQALRGLNAVMAMPRETGDGRQFLQRHIIKTHYQLQHASVTYPSQNHPALEKVSLEIRPGERIGVLGRIGSGKSTLLRLLAKLYEPTEGQVLLDGVDIVQYHPAAIRRQIGYLPQDATIFSGTLRENVVLGCEDATDEQVLTAIRLAGLEPFIQQNDRGLHALVGERGVLLSGGQRKSLALARSLVSEPQLLLLDEPSSSMDPETEKKFIQGLKDYLQADVSRTLLMTTHKLNMLGLVDRVILLDAGRVIADGPRDSILERLTGQIKKSAPAVSVSKGMLQSAVAAALQTARAENAIQ
ncbi:type I secretion system permease/ATPase [soil metagenome]